MSQNQQLSVMIPGENASTHIQGKKNNIMERVKEGNTRVDETTLKQLKSGYGQKLKIVSIVTLKKFKIRLPVDQQDPE